MKTRRTKVFSGLAALAALSTAAAVYGVAYGAASGSAVVQGVDFKYAEGKSTLKITFDREVEPVKSVSEADKQVILEIKDAKISKKLSRKLDTSSFNTNVTLVSPYQSGKDVRIVLQMKEMGDVDVAADGKAVVAKIDNGSAEAADKKIEAPAAEPAAPAEESRKSEVAGKNGGKSGDGNLAELESSLETKQYKGKKITIQLRDTEIQDVFRAISEASEFNIILGDDVKGKMTINLIEVPWDQALDILLKSNKLAAERSGNVLRIATIDAITREKEAELAKEKVVEAVEPLVVKIIPVSYGKIDNIKTILEDFLSKDPKNPTVKRGTIQIDTRTNALVIRDTAPNLEKLQRIMKELDTQTPQVLIEAKFVEVKESKNKDVQGRIFSTSREADATGALSFNPERSKHAAAFGGSFFGEPTNAVMPPSFSVTPVTGAAFGFSPKVGTLPRALRDVSAFLSILESEGTSKVIANPRVIAQNKEPAEISQGKQIQLATAAGPNGSGGFMAVNAILKLNVTPQVTGDGSINLKLTFTQDSPSPSVGGSLTLDTKKVDTSVLVDSGATLVIGGIYTSTLTETRAGIPFLRDIPIIGILFGSTTNLSEKGELFIFVTPRVINPKEAGFQG
ncbi:MAG: type IV pilus secretin PilQ [Deltaproteobacteria bacterium]|nr:type IV pilus secretin PilQ [Deltaproteobacteria bacterium]